VAVCATFSIAAAEDRSDGASTHASEGGSPTHIWYRQPAAKWTEALPLGNGRVGGMLFGAAPKERIQLNEESLWAGVPIDPYPQDAVKHWRAVQQLILEGKIGEARDLAMKKLTISPTSFRSYQPFGDLWIEFEHSAPVEAYRRELDLATGVARIRYRSGNVTWEREVFVSAVDDVMAIRLWTNKPGAIRARVRLTREKDVKVVAHGDTRLHLDGQIVDIAAPEGYDDNRGGSGPGGEHMRFAGRLVARTQGGTITGAAGHLSIEDADEAILLFTAATDYSLDAMSFDRSIDPGRTADGILERATGKSWKDLLRAHVQEHRSCFDRVAIDLGGRRENDHPTDERLKAVRDGGEDAGLEALYFQFGRYLLMSASRRPGRLPANLQGIWNDRMWAPWEADYHLDINLQMNYWPADLCNLSETLDPLVDWLEGLAEKGRRSAKRLYDADGWVTFACTNPFGRTTPSGSTKESQLMNGYCDPLAGAWMSLTLWRHYTFTHDEAFLRRRAYPILKGACTFILDTLVEDGKGHLVIAPSESPENDYVHPETGKRYRMSVGSTYHNELVRILFDAVVEASRILDVDEPFRTRLETTRKRIAPLQIGGDGTIQEWIEDFKEAEPGHRHFSHLIGLHPFAEITSDRPQLFDAAGKTLERRLRHGGGHTGWSRAWLINFLARLRQGDEAHKHVVMLLRKSTFPNLLDNHPPFQIDGNFGGTAGIAAMLVQSHEGEIHLLPALPKAWPEGSVRGLKARGGFVVDIAWTGGKLTRARIHAQRATVCRVRADGPVSVKKQNGEPVAKTVAPDVVEFRAEKGRRYDLVRGSSE